MRRAPPALRAIAVAALGVLATASCREPQRLPVVGCTESSRQLGLDDANVTGMTARQLGASFHVGDVAWSCSLSWSPLGDQTTATWSPHDTTTPATARLRFGAGATEVTGTPPAGTKLACPSSLAIDLAFDLTTDDGGFADSWTGPGVYLVGTDDLYFQVDPHTVGGIHGSYTFMLRDAWPQMSTSVAVGVFHDHVEGALTESAQRMTGSSSGEGFGINSAVWRCDQSTPAP